MAFDELLFPARPQLPFLQDGRVCLDVCEPVQTVSRILLVTLLSSGTPLQPRWASGPRRLVAPLTCSLLRAAWLPRACQSLRCPVWPAFQGVPVVAVLDSPPPRRGLLTLILTAIVRPRLLYQD